MSTLVPIPIDRLRHRRQQLGMSFSAVAERSGVSEPTVKRIFGGHAEGASFVHVAAVAAALGFAIGFQEQDVDSLRKEQALKKAEQIARLVQGTSALESQAVDEQTYQRLVDQSYHELLAGSPRRLWSA